LLLSRPLLPSPPSRCTAGRHRMHLCAFLILSFAFAPPHPHSLPTPRLKVHCRQAQDAPLHFPDSFFWPPPFLFFPLKVHWWRAQAVRFMLRWPSAHLCHVINQQRHTAYGMHVANRIARFAETQSELIAAIKAASHTTASTNSTSSTDSSNTGSLAAEAVAVGGMSFASSAVRAALARAPWAFHSPPYSLAQDQAAVQGGVEGVEGVGAVGAVGSGGGRRCDAVGGGGSSAAEAVSKLAGEVRRGDERRREVGRGEVAHEAYMVRPLVAVHVRGTDKEEEMGLLGLPVYMYFAHQVRLLLPDLRHAWINTESQ
ncbi:unnamed protein product, partial [Closterium sp. NIES-53]